MAQRKLKTNTIFNVKLSPALHASLKAIAATERTSLQSLVEEALRKHFKIRSEEAA